MVEKFKALLEQIEINYGEVILFAVMRMDNFADMWTIAIAADWISSVEEVKSEQFRRIVSLMREILTDQESLSIARIGLFQKEDYIPRLFLIYKSGQRIEDDRVNGFQIHEAYIIKSADITLDHSKVENKKVLRKKK